MYSAFIFITGILISSSISIISTQKCPYSIFNIGIFLATIVFILLSAVYFFKSRNASPGLRAYKNLKKVAKELKQLNKESKKRKKK